MELTSSDLAKFHISNVPATVLPEELAQHLGLIRMGREVRVDLVVDGKTGKCAGSGIVTVPKRFIDNLLQHNNKPFQSTTLVVQLIPENVLTNLKAEIETKDQPIDTPESPVPMETVADEDSISLEPTREEMIEMGEDDNTIVEVSTEKSTIQELLPKRLPIIKRKTTGKGILPYAYPMVDAAAILTHPKFRHDLKNVLERAESVGVEKIITLGMNIRGSNEARSLSKDYPGLIYWSAGVHPHEARSWSANMIDQLSDLANQEGCVAIGECGLDYNREFSPKHKQLQAFEAQVDLACKLRKPLILHVRSKRNGDADEDLRKILQKYHSQLPPTLVHCFSGEKADALKYIAMGFYIGITGFLFKSGRPSLGIRSLLKDDDLPLSKLIIETDCPFMFPFTAALPHDLTVKKPCIKNSTHAILRMANPQRCEPCLLPAVLEAVAGFMNKDPDVVADHSYRNAMDLYGLSY